MKKNQFIILFSILALASLIFFVFIPAFAGRLYINPWINLGIFQIRWYGLILGLAILTAYYIIRKNSWKFGIAVKDIDDYSFWAVLIGVLGARIYYVLFEFRYFFHYPAEIYKIWHGGLSIYGGVLAGLVYTYVYTRKKAYSFWQLFDLVALGLPLAQAIGRLGNFVNHEAYGSVTSLPWKMYVAADRQYHHPAFLYEIILDLLVFAILYKLLGKTKSGTIGLAYLALYSLGRFFIEGIRMDSFILYGFRVDQVVAFLVIVVSGSMLLARQPACRQAEKNLEKSD